MTKWKGKRVLALGIAVVLTGGYGTASLAQESEEEAEDIEEMVVTGSYIKRTNQALVASPLDTVGLEDIEASGWTDLEDVAETFTFNTSSWGVAASAPVAAVPPAASKCGGWDPLPTLVLQNGKRTHR